MDEIKQMAKTVAQCIKGDSKKTKGYDTAATVKRVDGGTLYVSIPGGVPETPVKKTIDAKVGDTVQVHVGNGTAWLTGNRTAPPTDDAEALKAKKVANTALDDATRARQAADTAEAYAQEAKQTTDEINAYAETAGKTVTQILNDGETAGVAAQEAKQSAENASEYASRALGNLSTVQSVSETLTWITQHGTMALTSDQHLDPTHVYFVVDAQGDYVVGSTHYSIVAEPDEDDLSTYYELTIDESLNNYVGTHLALDGEGLWLLPATSGTNKVLIATGAGSTYTTAGTYLLDSSGNVAASFRADGATIKANNTNIAHLGYGAGADSGGGTSNAPFYTLGVRAGNVGNYSLVEGISCEADGYASHAEGEETRSSGYYGHSEGSYTEAGDDAHAEGRYTTAFATASHTGGFHTQAYYANQTVIGKYNDNNSLNAFEIGNGQYNSQLQTEERSNAFTVDWNGDSYSAGEVLAESNIISATGEVIDGNGNMLSAKADSSSLATVATTGAYSDLTGAPTIPTVNNATLTIQKNGTDVETFTANASSNKTANITVPTNSDIVDLIYPVGAIYMSVNSTSPQTLFGGSWTQLQNRFLLGAGSSYTAGDTGGSADAIIPYHRHSVDSVSIGASGAHTHDAGNNQAFLRYNQGTVSTGVQERSVASGASGNYKAPVVNNANTDWSYLDKTSSETHTHTVPSHNTNYAGTSGNATGANMPPYLVVYMWKRTA